MSVSPNRSSSSSGFTPPRFTPPGAPSASVGDRNDLWTLFTEPSAYEQDRRFRTALSEVARLGLLWGGSIGLMGVVLYAALNTIVLDYQLVWWYTALGPSGHMAVPTLLLIAAGCMGLLALARAQCSLQTSRLAIAVVVLMSGALIVYDGVMAAGSISDYIVLVYLIGVTAVPFRPWQATALGAGLMAIIIGIGTPTPFSHLLLATIAGTQLPSVYAQLAFVGITTVLLTGVSAVLYLRHQARVRAQAALEANQQLFQQVESVARVGGWSVALPSGTMRCTREVYEIFEVEPSFHPSLDGVLTFFPSGARDRLQAAFKRCRSKGTPYDVELPMVTAEGTSRWVRANGEPVYRNGDIVRVVGAIQDITEQRRAKDRLQQREELLRSITENVTEGIYRSSLDDGFLYVNQAFAEMFGYASPEAVQEVDPAALYPASEDRSTHVRRLRRQGRVQGVEVRCRRKDGSTFIGRLTTTVTYADDGSVAYLDGVVTDITHRIERERQLQEAKDEAEAARRDAEVHRQRAEEASQSKSRFLAGVVHDLKSPLTAILGYAKLLQDECDAPQATHAGNIFKATENIRTMSETLLELSRLESGGLHLDVEARDVRPVVEDVAQTLGRRAREKGVDLQVNLPDQAAVAPIHPESLRRAVHNLVQNAVKYSAAGDRVALQATTDPTGPDASWTEASARRNGTPASGQTNDAAGNGRRVIVTVRDTGPGIAPDFLDTLFEPFARNASDTEGTGLGLSVTKELVEAMRGTIRVESEVGTGTCFQIALPMAPPREADASC